MADKFNTIDDFDVENKTVLVELILILRLILVLESYWMIQD